MLTPLLTTAAVLSLLAAQPADTPRPANPVAPAPPPTDRSPMADQVEFKRLAMLEGTWDVSLTFWFTPESKPHTTAAVCTAKMVLGGLFLEQRMEGGVLPGAMGGRPFSTAVFTSYNPSSKQYEQTRMSSTVPGPMSGAGTFDEAAGSFTISGQYTLMGMKFSERIVMTVPKDGRSTIESHLKIGDGPEWKGVEMQAVRRK